MKVGAFAVAVVLAVGCGGESTKQEGLRGGDAGAGDDTGGSSRGGTSSGGTNATSGTSGSGGNGTGGVVVDPIYLYDEDNYRTVISLSIPIVETAPGAELEICWTDVVSDLDCAEVDPQNEIDSISMLRFENLTEEEILEVLAVGEVSMEYLDGFLHHETAHASTCTESSSLSNFGSPVDFADEYREDDNLKYLFLFTRGTSPGVGSATMLFAKPTASSTNRELNAEPGCGMRTHTTALSEPVPVPFEGPWLVDWSNVTRDGQGNPFVLGNIDTATLWFVAGVTPSDIEDRIGELDRIATETYHLELAGGRSLSLTDMTSPVDGGAFASFSRAEDGVWLFGLACNSCSFSTFQRLLTIFEPTEAL